MNPWNPEAGDTPAPLDAVDRAIAERSADAMWRAFPYFQLRYGQRGRAFGRSDSGYLVTVAGLPDGPARAQLSWLGRLLAARGMPSLLLERQLELLGRRARRAGRAWADVMLAHAARMRAQQMAALPESIFRACETTTRAAGPRLDWRAGAGLLIAASVADRELGYGAHDEALVQFFCDADRANIAWRAACTGARRMALAALVLGGKSPR